MSFRQDCLRAFCIAVMAVPVFTLSSIAQASTPVGEYAESVFFAPPAPTARPGSFWVELFENLFGYAWSADVGVYQLHLAGPDELDQALPYTTLGTNSLGDPFLLTVRSILEVDIGQLSQDKQDVISSAYVDRGWVVYGDFETELGLVSTVAVLLQGSADDGSTWWRVSPGHFANVDADGVPLGDDDPLGHTIIAFEDCPCPGGPCDFGDAGQTQIAVGGGIIAGICVVAAGAAITAVACVASMLTCHTVADGERDFCYSQCDAGDFECLACCGARWGIAWDNCGWCGRNRPGPSDFSMCYDDDDDPQ